MAKRVLRGRAFISYNIFLAGLKTEIMQLQIKRKYSQQNFGT